MIFDLPHTNKQTHFNFFRNTLSSVEGTLEYGVMGSILSIPANYNHSMIVFYSSRGINEGVREWGQTMQRAYNRTNEHRLNDLTNSSQLFQQDLSVQVMPLIIQMYNVL